MFCPQCGSTQSDELRFCKSCGANLQALRQVMASRETDEKFDWNKTWLAEMFQSSDIATKRAAEIDLLMGRTPEEKRLNEIKAGVIAASVGVGIMVLLFVLMNGIILSGRVSDAAAEILSRIWIVGVIPLLIGAALIFNGVFVSRKGAQRPSVPTETKHPELDGPIPAESLPPADTNELFPASFSVTDETTRHLKQPRS
jgi:hypothetical protein